MAHTKPCRALGFEFAVETDDLLLADVLGHCYRDLPPARRDAAPRTLRVATVGDPPGYLVELRDGGQRPQPLGSGRTRSSILELLFWEVNRRAIASVATQPVLHAAVLGGPLGAVALCGVSQSGKSTLCAAAARRAWHHLSDDLGPVDVETMTVAPYARPIMLRPGGRALLGEPLTSPQQYQQFFSDEWFVPASVLGATVVTEPRPLVAVGFLGWSDDASIEPLSRAETLEELVRHRTTVEALGGQGFADLARIAAAVPGFRVGLGSPSEVLDLLIPLLNASTDAQSGV